MSLPESASQLKQEVNNLRLQFKDLKAAHDQQQISIGNYLLTRLVQLGVGSIFGVPGDFNLGFLVKHDYLSPQNPFDPDNRI